MRLQQQKKAIKGQTALEAGSSSPFERVIDDEGAAHYTFDFEYDKEKSGTNAGSKSENKKKYLLRVKSTLRIVLQVRGSKARAEN